MNGARTTLAIALCAAVLGACSSSPTTSDRIGSDDPPTSRSPATSEPNEDRSERPEADAPSTPEDPAPDFAFETFEGETFRLSGYRGQPLVLNFWESW